MGATSELYIQMQDEIFNTIHQAEEGEISHLDALILLSERKRDLEISVEMIKNYQSDKLNEISDELFHYPQGYKGYTIKVVNGRRSFNFKNIPEYLAIENKKKEVEERYKMMFEAKEKGLSYANVNEDGEELPLPTVSYSGSYITLKKQR